MRENLLEFHSPDEMTRSLRNRTGYCVRAAPGALDETERAWDFAICRIAHNKEEILPRDVVTKDLDK